MKISLFKGILLGVFGLAAIIGIFVFATHTGNRQSPDEVGPVVIWGTLPRADVQNALIAIGQTNSIFKSVSYVEKDAASLPSELATAIATGNGPDLVFDSQENLRALSKFLTPIPSTILPPATFTNAFVGGASVFAAQDGYYGIPLLVDPLVLYFNRPMLSTHGIAKPPETWEALIGLVPNIAVLTPSRQVTRGLIGLGTYTNVTNARGILSALFLQQGVPVSAYSASGVLAASLGATQTSGTSPGASVLGFYTQFADPAKVSYTWNASLQDSRQAFLVGDVALYIGYASEARYLRAANPNLDFGVSILPQPATATFKATYGRIYAFMIPNGAKNSAGAYKVAVEFTNSAETTAMVSNTSLAPATLSELVSLPVEPAAAVAYTEALYTKTWLSPLPADTDVVFSGMIASVITGRSSLIVALSNAERSLTALLQQ